jgi:hypothetical protein
MDIIIVTCAYNTPVYGKVRYRGGDQAGVG